MNNKWILLLIISFASLLVIGSVSASDLTVRDFDNHFSMKTPKGVSFQKEEQPSNDEIESINIIYSSENLALVYMDSPVFSQNSSVAFVQQMFESSVADLNECYEIQDGNVEILKPKTVDETHPAIAAVSTGSKMLFIMGTDFDSLKEMAHSVKFK